MRDQRKKRPTQSDVARLAGVSQAIVSYVLNGRSAEVAEETRERVQGAMDVLGYVPNGSARSLRTQKTMTIACIIPDITNPFYPALERGIQRIAESHGYDLIVFNTDGIAEKETRAINSLRRGQVDGAFIVPFHLDVTQIQALHEMGVAITLLHALRPDTLPLRELGIDFITIDTSIAAEMAIDYLVERGYSRIGMIAGIAGTPPREDRVRGYLHALHKHGFPFDDLLMRAGDYQEAGGYEAMQELLKLPHPPDAIFAANDLMALGAMLAIREAGLRIPDDIAIVGLDDIPAARLVHPPMTTIAQFPEDVGHKAAHLLLSRLSGAGPPLGRVVDCPVRLVPRDSA